MNYGTAGRLRMREKQEAYRKRSKCYSTVRYDVFVLSVLGMFSFIKWLLVCFCCPVVRRRKMLSGIW